MKKIFIIMGNPDSDSLSGKLAKEYERGAQESGHEVRKINIGDLHFDPILHKGYKIIQELEPDLIRVQENINWAGHVVFIYPNWWNTMPALLKGMFDRMWLPGFAFNFDGVTKKLIQLLKGKSARVIVIAGTHSPLVIRWKYGDYTNEIKRGILEFAGMCPVKLSCFGPSEHCGEKKHKQWLEKVYTMGKKGV